VSSLVELSGAVSELVSVTSRLKPSVDDEGEPTSPEVRFVRDDAALLQLLRRHRLPTIYESFLRDYSSHDFVDAGLTCGRTRAWIAPVDNLASVNECYAASGFPPRWLVCATDYEGCYVLDLGRVRDGDCPVLYVAHGGGLQAREVAPSFVGFLRRIARESARGQDAPAQPPTLVAAESQGRGRLAVGYVLIGLAALVVIYMMR